MCSTFKANLRRTGALTCGPCAGKQKRPYAGRQPFVHAPAFADDCELAYGRFVGNHCRPQARALFRCMLSLNALHINNATNRGLAIQSRASGDGAEGARASTHTVALDVPRKPRMQS